MLVEFLCVGEPMNKVPTQTIVKFSSQLRYEDIPKGVVEHCKRIILDSMVTAIAASTLGDACPQAIKAITSNERNGRCSVFGTTHKASAVNAAFLNGALVHALNFDATGDEIGHQGVVCLAAPYALAELTSASGKELIVASVVACEVSARVTAAISRTGRHPSEKFLAGQLLSYFGAAAGAARILSLGESQTHSTLGLALMQISGSRQHILTGDAPAKSIYGGFPNQAAVQSALLARAGVDARCELFGEPAGLYAMVYDGSYLPDVISEGLGREYLLLDANIKLWPCSLHIHDFVSAAISLASENINPENIASIEVLAPANLRPWTEPIAARRRPANPSAAANSVQYCVARALLGGALSLDDFTLQALSDPAIHRLTGLIEVALNTQSDPIKITVRLKNGDCLEKICHERSAPGVLELDRNALLGKARSCCRFSKRPFGGPDVDALIEGISRLEELADAGDLYRRFST